MKISKIGKIYNNKKKKPENIEKSEIRKIQNLDKNWTFAPVCISAVYGSSIW